MIILLETAKLFRVCRQLTSIPRDAYGRRCGSKYWDSYFLTEKCLLSRNATNAFMF